MLRRSKLDDLTLVPGTLLPFEAHDQRIANNLPASEVLIVLSPTDTPLRNTLQTVVDLVRAKGHRVTTLPSERFDSPVV